MGGGSCGYAELQLPSRHAADPLMGRRGVGRREGGAVEPQ